MLMRLTYFLGKDTFIATNFVLGPRILGLMVSGAGSCISRSQVLGPDFRLCQIIFTLKHALYVKKSTITQKLRKGLMNTCVTNLHNLVQKDLAGCLILI